ncbi:MAG TPA: site-specific DNA-methyltransferase [Armatimonadota bacterium]|nr:site-specific DNA-methyltransferase [Armatimonadota bacterium]
MRNTLYYGDNLPIMREHIADESVDLVYLDPPFNSARDYNVLFKQAKKDENQAQITAFTDTWQWSKRRYEEFFEDPRNARLFDLMESLYRILGQSEMMAYLLMMAPRVLELHRVLKRTGSLYLHCDPVASHYLKILLDVAFGPQRFVNEITWKRTSSHNDSMKWMAVADTIFYYCKGRERVWNPQFLGHDPAYVHEFYRHEDERGVYRLDHVIRSATMGLRPNLTYEYKGYTPPYGWRVVREKLEKLDAEGRIEWSGTGRPYLKRYLHEQRGTRISSLITDIPPIGAQAQERMGYPTQKPLALLERIVSASSNPGDLVLDPFCGCGTAVVAAEKLGRKWIGIDITYIALDLMISRLAENFGLKRGQDYDVIGDPKDAYSAHKLFEESPKQFEIWAVGLVAGVPQPDKSGDKGIDGKVYFMDLQGKLQWAVCQVKGGHLTPSVIRDFAHVIEREKAAMGFFICLETPTKGMCREADELGFFDSPSGRKIAKLQVRTIKELLEGNEFDFPKGYSLKSGGGKKLVREGEQGELGM